MAVVNTKSTEVTNLDAEPSVSLDNVLSGGRMRKRVATVEVAAADDDGSVYRLFRVHSSWSIHSIKRLCDAVTGGTAYDVGLYETADNGGAAVDDDCYASAVSMASADNAGTELAFEARDIAGVENKVWQDAGQSSDPNRYYDLCLTADTVGSAAGTISAVLGYTDGS